MAVRRTLPTRADGRASNKFAGTKKKPPAKTEVSLALPEGMNGESLAKLYAPDAIDVIRHVMWKGGRNSATRLRAAEIMMRYGVQEPAKAQTITTDNTTRMQGEITINLVPAKDGKRAE